ncbi:hypothetical protein ABL78_6746 [Leptomonas seymouri]|uniref:Uncharacterized protein n=1 Tax=Leptomonas seymouri TaxID=5684 RepID=A0A0N0P3J6_LEPSE|nr:hypothetical protein ABL78_6746 [Leptomonas seymouri]|eukprot:KPI84206.1 hypothetical protein ABL78_6746 [Leptomonas seymouri]
MHSHVIVVPVGAATARATAFSTSSLPRRHFPHLLIYNEAFFELRIAAYFFIETFHCCYSSSMPGKEAPQPPRTGATARSTTRRAATTAAPYDVRRGPLSSSTSTSSSRLAKPGDAAQRIGPLLSSTRSGQVSQAPHEAALPACSTCVACYKASEEVLRASTAVLTNAKSLFLDDVVHHYSGDEAWIRVLRSLGWAEASLQKPATSPSAAP